MLFRTVAALVLSALSLQTQTTFRSASTLVPVDVRVLDAHGNPITDLTEKDFTVFENGVVQPIGQFTQHTLTADAAPSTGPAVRRTNEGATLAPQNQRIFLIALGRGRLQPPAKGVDAALAFVRDRLMPQDVVAVMAWNRATDFTTNRDQILGVLQRFKTRHEKIENGLANWFSGMQAVYGGTDMPPHLQRLIDEVFVTHGGPAARDLPDEKVVVTPKDVAGLDMSFEEYMSVNKQTLQDVSNLYTGIEYLRYIEGEKHLIYVTETGFLLPSADGDEGLAALANDARVAIDTIQTGGLGGFSAMAAPDFNSYFATSSLKSVSKLTGGQWSIQHYASDAIDRIDRATRSSYLLGYYPQNTALDGRYRRISVAVNRKGATVLYRRGYFGRDRLAPPDRTKAMSYARITAAATITRDIKDLSLELKANNTTDRDSGGRVVSARINVTSDRVQFEVVDGQHMGVLHIAVFCGNGREGIVGQRWRDMELSFPEDLYRSFLKTGLAIELKVPITADATYVKAVVYDPNADLLGSSTVRIR